MVRRSVAVVAYVFTITAMVAIEPADDSTLFEHVLKRSHLYILRDATGKGRTSLKAHRVTWEPAEGEQQQPCEGVRDVALAKEQTRR